MIILLRLRNLTIFALVVLSISFIYIGYIGFGNDQLAEEKSTEEKNAEVSIETMEPLDNTSERENPLVDFPALDEAEQIKENGDFFVEYRMKRDKGRDAQIEILKDLVNNPNSSSEIRDKAQDKLFTISESIALEVKAENLLRAKGYEKSVVAIEKGNVTIVIENDELKERDMTRIGDLVMRATGFGLENIAIIPK